MNMKFLVLLFSCVCLNVSAEKWSNTYQLEDLGMDAHLEEHQVGLTFLVYDDFNELCHKNVLFFQGNEEIYPECNDSSCSFLLDSTQLSIRISKSETYNSYINENLIEQHQYRIKVYLKGRKMQVRKPVIYIHTLDTVHLNLELTTPCEKLFSYPQISNDFSWKLKSYPNGNLEHQNKAYRYIFWDGEISFENFSMPEEEAFYVESDSILSFLENNLNAFGFTSQEKSDFITYWYPMMKSYAGVKIRFLFNEEVKNISVLKNNLNLPVYQFYMLWTPVKTEKKHVNTPYSGNGIPKILEDNNYILEWGGIEINNLKSE